MRLFEIEYDFANPARTRMRVTRTADLVDFRNATVRQAKPQVKLV
jgi:hypothetical protein